MGIFSRLFLKLHSSNSNKVIAVDLLDELIKIEKQMGRNRNPHPNENKYESRIIDIDILFYGSSNKF